MQIQNLSYSQTSLYYLQTAEDIRIKNIFTEKCLQGINVKQFHQFLEKHHITNVSTILYGTEDTQNSVTLLQSLIEKENVEVITELLLYSPLAPSFGSIYCKKNCEAIYSPLMYAIRKGKYQMARHLLQFTTPNEIADVTDKTLGSFLHQISPLKLVIQNMNKLKKQIAECKKVSSENLFTQIRVDKNPNFALDPFFFTDRLNADIQQKKILLNASHELINELIQKVEINDPSLTKKQIRNIAQMRLKLGRHTRNASNKTVY